jgi:hypothetical protein
VHKRERAAINSNDLRLIFTTSDLSTIITAHTTLQSPAAALSPHFRLTSGSSLAAFAGPPTRWRTYTARSPAAPPMGHHLHRPRRWAMRPTALAASQTQDSIWVIFHAMVRSTTLDDAGPPSHARMVVNVSGACASLLGLATDDCFLPSSLPVL